MNTVMKEQRSGEDKTISDKTTIVTNESIHETTEYTDNTQYNYRSD